MGDSPSPQYGLPLDRESTRFKAFCAKQRFTLEEFACLLAGIDPTSFDGSPASNAVFDVKVGGYVRLLKEAEKETIQPWLTEDDVPF